MFSNYHYFEAIKNYGSLSKAAKALGISQPALSSYLISLEKKVGATLFDRSHTPVTLTEQGKIYYKYLKGSAAIEHDFYNEMHDADSCSRSTINVAGASSTTACYLSRVTTDFLSKHPEVSINIYDGVVMDIARKALTGEIDFFITPEKLKNDDFEYVHLLDERIFLCIPVEYEINAELTDIRIDPQDFTSGASQRKSYAPVELSLLKDERFILLENGTNMRAISDALFTHHGFLPKDIIVVSQMLTGFNLTAFGAGISFIPESILRLNNFGKLPCFYALDASLSYRSMYACYKKDRYMLKACREYINMLKEI